MSSLPLHLFPTNGLDRSLHAPVVVGLVLVSFFTEAFGWTYAGLVVPGYLAAAFIAAPVTACLVLAEAVITHLAVLLIASVIPRYTGAWSTTFGRERFFLYIVVAVIVRLAVEGSLVPWASARYPLAHSRELYSIGLVLVPLVANVFWSAGMLHSAPRLMVLTGLTYLFVSHVLLEYTNFSLSRFEVANESVALHFLETSKAYLLLLSGAMLGARGNVRYGWDYNGILVPALLAVAWYQPLHVLGTAVEGVVIYLLARWLASTPPWSRVALVGSRRMLFVAVLGLFVKLVLGHALAHFAPKVHITEYLGFGYILPSLLAVKMWNKSAIGIVLMPTLQVSLGAFLLGNALGFGLNWATSTPARASTGTPTLVRVDSVPFELLLASTEPAPRAGECVPGPDLPRLAAAVRRGLAAGAVFPADVSEASEGALQVSADADGWFAITARPRVERRCQSFRAALSPAHAAEGNRLIVRVLATPHDTSGPVAALGLAEATHASMVLLGDRLDPTAADARLLPDPFADAPTLWVGVAEVEGARLRVRGALPEGLDVGALERRLGQRIEVDWASGVQGSAELTVSRTSSEALAAALLGTMQVETWPGSLRRELGARAAQLLSAVYEEPRIEALRLLSRAVLPALQSGAEPGPWALSVAHRLGYRLASAGGEGDRAWILHELASPSRRGLATWVVRRTPSEPLAVEVPAALWELGTLSLGLGLFDAERARYLLLGGARPDALPNGVSDPRRGAGKSGTFQRIHEHMLESEVYVLAIHGAAQDVTLASDVVIELDHPVLDSAQVPPWIAAHAEGLARGAGLVTGWYGAGLEHVQLGAQFDPAFAFAERFAPGRMARLWFSERTRSRAPRVPAADWALRQLLPEAAPEGDVAARALELLDCRGAACAERRARCDLDGVVERLGQWLAVRNPFERVAAVAGAQRCGFEVTVDRATGSPWAIVASAGRARLVPLHGGAPARRSTGAPLATLDAVRRAVDLGVGTVLAERQ